MTSVAMRVDTGGSNGIPHTFLVVTHPDGRQIEYGLTPANHSKDSVIGLNGPGIIDLTGPGAGKRPHEYNFDGASRNLTDAQYAKLMEYINSSIANPPMYHVLGVGDDPRAIA